MRYKAPRDQKARWLHSVRDLYEQVCTGRSTSVDGVIYCTSAVASLRLQATLDFVQLQCIDYASEFGCHCNAGIIADGITLGFNQSQAYLVNPAQAVRDAIVSAEQLVRGSLFEDRTFVKKARIRDLLRKFASEGLAEEEHAALLDELEYMSQDSLEYSLLPFLQSSDSVDSVKAEPVYADILYILGTSAPACQLLKPCVYLLCQRFADGQRLGTAEMLQLQRHCPHLAAFVKHGLQHTGHRADAEELVKRLIMVMPNPVLFHLHSQLLVS